MSDLAPAFLVAVPQLGDPNFQRSLILLMDHSDEGALGLVLNRPAPVSLAEVAKLNGMPARPELEQTKVHIGGPVSPERGFVVHDIPGVGDSVTLVDGLYLSSSLETLKELLAGPPAHFRLCLGYAGWGPGQLEDELREGSWITAPLAAQHVLGTPPDKMWDAVLRGLGIDPAMILQGGGLH